MCQQFMVVGRLMRVIFLAWCAGVAQAAVVAATTPAAPAQRIVSTAPALTELVFAAGAGGRLVASSAFSDFPPQAKKIPQVADAGGINIEALLAVKPDLVLVWASGTRLNDIQRLQALGIRAESITVISMADVPMVLRKIGQWAGTAGQADTAAADFERRLIKLQNQFSNSAPLPVFFEISRVPLMTINGRHFISEVIRTCGGENVFADVAPLVFAPSREMLLVKNPQVVLYGGTLHAAGDAARDNRAYAGSRAEQTGQVVAVTADWVMRPGPRLIDAAEQICGVLEHIRRKKPIN